MHKSYLAAMIKASEGKRKPFKALNLSKPLVFITLKFRGGESEQILHSS